jgi:hypothetical protein
MKSVVHQLAGPFTQTADVKLRHHHTPTIPVAADTRDIKPFATLPVAFLFAFAAVLSTHCLIFGCWLCRVISLRKPQTAR